MIGLIVFNRHAIGRGTFVIANTAETAVLKALIQDKEYDNQ
jgi:hypothetical protein